MREENKEPAKKPGPAGLTERPGRDAVVCPRCEGACMTVDLGGDPDDCRVCGGSGINKDWATPPKGCSEIEAAAWVLTALYFRQEGWAVYHIPEFDPLLLAFGFQTANEQAALKEWRERNFEDPNPFCKAPPNPKAPEPPQADGA